MIKLKLNSDEIKSLINFLQTGIEIAREEMAEGKDIVAYKAGATNFINDIPWLKSERQKNILRIAERNVHIDEFEKLQLKSIIKIDRNFNKKTKTIAITKAAGYYLLIYMDRAEHYIKNEYTKLVARTQANIILKELI
jgi:hypothetical protein